MPRAIPSRPKHLAVFSMGGIGDTVRLLPFLRALRNSYPKAYITFIHNGGIKDISLFASFYDEALPVRPSRDFYDRFSSQHATPYSVFAHCQDILPRLCAKKIDLGWAFGFNESTGNCGTLLLALAGAHFIVGAHYGNFHEYVDIACDVPKTPTLHGFYSLGLHPLGIDVDTSSVALPIDDSNTAWASDFLAQHQAKKEELLVALHTGSAGMVNTKMWPAERFMETAHRLHDRFGARIVLTGSQAEKPSVDSLMASMPEGTVNAAGCTDLPRLCALLHHVQLLITNDTSPLHLADAVATPRIIGIFGPTQHERILPPSDRIFPVQSDLHCTCTRFDANDPAGRCTREIPEECLHRISTDQVWETAVRALGELGYQEKDMP